MTQDGAKRGSIKAGFPIGNPKNAHKSMVFTKFFSKGHFEMILTTTLLFMTDDRRSRQKQDRVSSKTCFPCRRNAHFYDPDAPTSVSKIASRVPKRPEERQYEGRISNRKSQKCA